MITLAHATRLIGATLLLVCATFSIPRSAAQAEESAATEILQDIASLQTAVGHVRDVERVAARLFYVESLALIAHQGNWPFEKPGWDADATPFEYDVARLSERLQPDLVDIKRKAAQGNAFTEEEQAAFQDLLTQTEQMIADTNAYYDLLQSEQHDAANAYFRDRVRTTYSEITAAAFTLSSQMDRKISKAQLELRLAK